MKKNKIEQANIYQHEVDYINNLNVSYEAKKILFTFLVKRKFDFWSFLDNQKIRNSAHTKIKLRRENFFKYVRELFECEAIDYDNQGFIIFNPPLETDGSQIAITVTNHDKAGLYLDFINHVPLVKWCDKCNEPFKARGNKAKYCDVCSGVVAAKQAKERMKKYRGKIPVTL